MLWRFTQGKTTQMVKSSMFISRPVLQAYLKGAAALKSNYFKIKKINTKIRAALMIIDLEYKLQRATAVYNVDLAFFLSFFFKSTVKDRHTTYCLVHQTKDWSYFWHLLWSRWPIWPDSLGQFSFPSGNFDPPAFQLIVSHYLLFVPHFPRCKRLQKSHALC